MKILYVLPEIPYPPDNGVRIKAFNIINSMRRQHECHVLSFHSKASAAGEDEFRKVAPEVRIIGLFPTTDGIALQAKRLKYLLRGLPVFMARSDTFAFSSELRRALRTSEYDVIHLDGILMAPLIKLCRMKPTVVSPTDAISLAYKRRSLFGPAWLRLYLGFAARLTRRLERSYLPLANAVHVVSDVDRRYLMSITSCANVEAIGTGLTDAVVRYRASDCPANAGRPRLLFTGSLRTAGVTAGLLEFLNGPYLRIIETFPDVEMVVLGRYASPRTIQKITAAPNVKFCLWVEDYLETIAGSCIVILPELSGTGIKNRALDAMALGKPVVGSPFAVEGIPVQDGTHCYICHRPEQFSENVITLLRDPNQRIKMGRAARELVFANYAPEVIGQKWEDLYMRVIANFHSLQPEAAKQELNSVAAL